MDALTALARKFKNPEHSTDRGEEQGRVYRLEDLKHAGDYQEPQDYTNRSIPLRAGVTALALAAMRSGAQGDDATERCVPSDINQDVCGGDFSQAGSWDDFNQDFGSAWDCHDPGWGDIDQSAGLRGVGELPDHWEEKARNLLSDIA